jgi:uncharacterized protein
MHETADATAEPGSPRASTRRQVIAGAVSSIGGAAALAALSTRSVTDQLASRWATTGTPVQHVTGPAHAARPATRLGRFGALLSADSNGWRLPKNVTSHVVAISGQRVDGTSYVFPNLPDGACCVPRAAGGWYLCWNSEVDDGLGAVSVLAFDRNARLERASALATGLSRPCSGGLTPWATWLSCEEVALGRLVEMDPRRQRPTTAHRHMGLFRREAAVVDPTRRVVYMSEDEPDGLLYRFRYERTADLSAGTLEAAVLEPHAGDPTTWNVSWTRVPNPTPRATTNADPTNPPPPETIPCRYQTAAYAFDGGEGLTIIDHRLVVLSTKGDDKLWLYDAETSTMSVLYDGREASASGVEPTLTGVDNLTLSPGNDILVCEDGGSMDLVAVQRDGRVERVATLTGQRGSELAGVCISPNGRHIYVASQRGVDASRGIVYRLTGSFPW